MRWSGYPQLESTNEVARAASAIEDPSGLGRLNPSGRATETRRIAQREMGLILPSVEAVIPPQEFVWDRAKLYPKQEAAIFERKRISVIEASTKSGKTDPACSMVGGVTSARSA